jgi:peptidyl-prolyl cis-trans isomerase C/foldase protein PrsA
LGPERIGQDEAFALPTIPRTRVYLLFAILISFMACDLLGGTEDKVVMSVGDKRVTTKELKRDLTRLTFELGMTDQETTELINPLVERIIDHYLILEYGKQERIDVSDQELDAAVKEMQSDYPEEAFQEMLLHGYIDFDEWKEKLRQQLLVKKIIERASRTLDPITPREIRAYYDSHRDEFTEPAAVRFRQVVTKSKDEATQVLRRLKDGEDLGELAVRYSISPEGERAGEVGWIAKGVLDESMEKVLFSLPIGKTGPVVESPYGYHVFEVMARRPEGFKSLPDAMDEIEVKLLEEKKEAFYGQWLKELRRLFTVKVNRELLETLELG